MITKNKNKVLARAKDRAEIAKLRRSEAIDKALTKIIKTRQRPKGKYDTIDQLDGYKRKHAKVQTGDTDDRISLKERGKGAEIGRHLQENTATWRTLMQQFKVAAIGANGPKIQVNTKDNFAKAAALWFNSDWAKWCDQCDDTPLAEQVAIAMQYVKREGDVLCIFDDFIENDGRLRWVESTQIIGMEDKAWSDWAIANKWTESEGGKVVPLKLSNGIIMNSRGVVKGYLFTSLHGKTMIDPKTDPFSAVARYDIKTNPQGSAKLIKAPWRVNQRRGEADALAVANQQQDIYEVIAAELQTVKKSAQIAGWIEVDKESDSVMTGIANALLKQGKSETEVNALINGDGTNAGLVGMTYDSLEALTGGKWEYLNPGEKAVFHNPDRPNMNVTEFIDWIQIATGASMGVGRARSTGKAETSYTAFRGEEIMTWQTFEWEQKFLERRLMDFLGVKAIQWALSMREISEKAPDQWEKKLSWSWPKMREVDELKAEQAMQLRLKNGTANFADTLGPDWEEKLGLLASQLELARKLKLPLSIFETVSGTVIDDKANDNTDTGTGDINEE